MASACLIGSSTRDSVIPSPQGWLLVAFSPWTILFVIALSQDIKHTFGGTLESFLSFSPIFSGGICHRESRFGQVKADKPHATVVAPSSAVLMHEVATHVLEPFRVLSLDASPTPRLTQ